jgi:hypothetical protein
LKVKENVNKFQAHHLGQRDFSDEIPRHAVKRNPRELPTKENPRRCLKEKKNQRISNVE